MCDGKKERKGDLLRGKPCAGSSPAFLRNTSPEYAQTNGHIWAVSYEEDNLYVDFYHGRADGAGLYPLLATLLFYYYQELEGLSDDSGIRTLEKPITVAETHDPVDDLL